MGLTVRDKARMERIRILLRTRNDAYPSPRSLSIPSTPSGPGPGRKRRCPVCGGSGRVRKTLTCQACEGAGSFDYDSYVGRVAGSETKRSGTMEPGRVEAELQRLSTSLKLSEGHVDPEEKYGWEREIERRNRQGSYRELNRALERLRDVDPLGRDYLRWIYDTGLNVEVSSLGWALEEQLVAMLASWMPAKIKLPKHLAAELARAKEEKIRSLMYDNLSVEEIAEVVLCSVRTVRRVIGKREAVTNP